MYITVISKNKSRTWDGIEYLPNVDVKIYSRVP